MDKDEFDTGKENNSQPAVDYKDCAKILERFPESVVIHDRDGEILYINSTLVAAMRGKGAYEFVGKPIYEFIHPNYRSIVALRRNKALQGHILDFMELKMVTPQGRTLDIEAAASAVTYMGKEAVLSVIKDITNRKSIEMALSQSEAKYRSLVEGALIGVYTYQDGRLVYVNRRFEKISGYMRDELYNLDLKKLIVPEDRNMLKAYIKRLYSGEREITEHIRGIKKDGSIADIEIQGTKTVYKGMPAVIGTVIDITERKNAERQINHMAYHDALTGLPNRYLLNDYLRNSLAHSEMRNESMAVMFIDLDRFKMINDTMGHSFGDMLLHQVSKRLVDCVGEGHIISRYGGDEFVIIMEDVDKYRVSLAAQNIIDSIGVPFVLNGHEVFISPSIGVCLFPDDGRDVETLVKNADTAMYLAKERGRCNYQFYTSSLNEDITRKMKLENGLRKAVDNNEFTLFYQPKVELDSGNIVGVEALIRWYHPELGIVSPGEFIPLAEETGLIVPIGRWVLERACWQNKMWQTSGFSPVPVAVNVSVRQFQDRDFTRMVEAILQKTGLKPEYLELEITESMMQNAKDMAVILEDLKSMGVKVAIDDFGTGYSLLSVLKYLNIDNLKIDQSFLDDIMTNPNTAAIMKVIIDMGQNLNFNVVAEGIESKEQLLALKKTGA